MTTGEKMKLHSNEMLEFLRNEIQSERFASGDRLPSIAALSRKFKLSSGQVRYGLEKLKQECLLVSRHGKGFFVMNKGKSVQDTQPLTIALDILNRKIEFYDSIIAEAIRTELGDYHILQTISPISDIAFERGMPRPDAVMLFRTASDEETFRKWSKYSVSHQVPVLFFNRFPAQKNLSYLSVDYDAECFRVVSRMLNNGAKNIVFYQSCSSRWLPLQPRLTGFLKAYTACGMDYPKELLIGDDSLTEQIRFIELLKSGTADILFCPCGDDLINAVSTAVSAGLSLRELLPIFCFDDVGNLAERMNLPVSYVKMPLARMGRIAANYIQRRSFLPELPPIRESFEAAVCVQSCKYLI